MRWVPEPSCARRNRSASECSLPSGHTIVHDRRPPSRSIRCTRRSPITTGRATPPPGPNVTDIANPVGNHATRPKSRKTNGVYGLIAVGNLDDYDGGTAPLGVSAASASAACGARVA